MPYYDQNKVHFESVSAVTATPSDQLGAIRREGNEEYIYVYNKSGQISPGYAAIVSGITGFSVSASSTTGADLAVGVCKHTTLTTGTYGWLVTRGFVKVQMEADNSAAAGGLLTLAADGEWAHKSNSTGYPAPAYGKTIEAIASGASGMAFVKIF